MEDQHSAISHDLSQLHIGCGDVQATLKIPTIQQIIGWSIGLSAVIKEAEEVGGIESYSFLLCASEIAESIMRDKNGKASVACRNMLDSIKRSCMASVNGGEQEMLGELKGAEGDVFGILNRIIFFICSSFVAGTPEKLVEILSQQPSDGDPQTAGEALGLSFS